MKCRGQNHVNLCGTILQVLFEWIFGGVQSTFSCWRLWRMLYYRRWWTSRSKSWSHWHPTPCSCLWQMTSPFSLQTAANTQGVCWQTMRNEIEVNESDFGRFRSRMNIWHGCSVFFSRLFQSEWPEANTAELVRLASPSLLATLAHFSSRKFFGEAFREHTRAHFRKLVMGLFELPVEIDRNSPSSTSLRGRNPIVSWAKKCCRQWRSGDVLPSEVVFQMQLDPQRWNDQNMCRMRPRDMVQKQKTSHIFPMWNSAAVLFCDL